MQSARLVFDNGVVEYVIVGDRQEDGSRVVAVDTSVEAIQRRTNLVPVEGEELEYFLSLCLPDDGQ